MDDPVKATVSTDSLPGPGGQSDRLAGAMGRVVRYAAIGLSLYIVLYVSTILDYVGIHLYGAHRPLAYAGVLFIAFMVYPASSRSTGRVPWYDFALAAVGMFASLYAFSSWETWMMGVSFPTAFEMWLGVAIVLISLEASRRVLGLTFTLVAALFIVYPLVGPYLPGFLATRAYSLPGLVQFFYLSGGGSGLFGTPMEIFTTTVALFLIFGAFLQATGAATIFLDAAMGLAGRFRSGMAKVAVISSALFATISGVGVANVLVTGSFTIPAMKRMGYRPSLAAAVEAAASTGGILMPPVMGAAAFLMADILAVPYWSIVVAALLPGLLYYVAMFTMVDFEGARDELQGVPEDQIPPLGATLKRGWYLLASIVVLLVALGWAELPVDQSALLALAVLVILGALRKDGLRLPAVIDGLESGGRLLGEIGSTGAVVGIIMSGFALTGLGAMLPQAMQAVAGDSLLLLLVLAAVASIILGMGAPPLLVYVLLAATVAPAIIKMGVSPIAAHMFIFYFGLMSMLTPPVALSALIAARVAGANFWRTSIEACRLGIIAFIIPFFFVYQPVLLFEGEPGQLVHAVVSSVAGVVALGGALTRYFFIRPIPLWEAVPLGLGGILLLYPEGYSDLIGLVLMAPSIILTVTGILRRRALAPAKGGGP